MRIVKSNDFYSIKVRGYVTSLHLEILDVLYQPILGPVGTSLYRYLFSTREFHSGSTISFKYMSEHLSLQFIDITNGMNNLEALGLCRSFLIERKEFNEFVIELYSPKDPAEFSKDQIFMHLLNEKLGPKHTQDLIALFHLDVATNSGVEVSSNFTDIYGPKVKGITDVNTQNINPLENVIGGIRIQFDESLFYNLLTRNRSILPNALSLEEVKMIKQLAGLYNLSEEAMVEKVADHYMSEYPFGKRVDFSVINEKLKELIKYPNLVQNLRPKNKKIKGDSEKVNIINNMEAFSPFDFLINLNHGAKIAPADQRLIEDLAILYNLPAPVINALVYYNLENNDNKLSRPLMEKQAGTLGRSKISSAIDALDTLEKPVVRKQRKYKKAETSTPETNQVESNTEDDSDFWDSIRNI